MGFFKLSFFLLLASGLFANSIKDPFFGYKTFKEVDTNMNENKFDKFNFVVTDELLENLTPDEFEALNENMKKIAVKRQSEQDIKNFLIIKNYVQKKADEFKTKAQIIGLQNQEYDLSLDIAKSKFAKNVQTQANTAINQEFWQNIRDNSIIVVFYDEVKEVENRAVEMVLNYAYQERV
ncbi:MAG: conjugal transfer protein TraF, partial [Aliarcobacter sp.]|nr:conjugal transfer protein TraF [Aliarcobacter sp.]